MEVRWRDAAAALAGTAFAALLAQPAGAVDKVTFGQVSPTATVWPGTVATKKGFFAANNVEMDVISIGVSPGMQAVAAGSLDIMHNTCNAPISFYEGGGTNVRISMVSMSTHPAVLIGRKGMKGVEELKGKVVAVNRGTVYDSWARGLEDKIGWKIESFGTSLDAAQAVLTDRAAANITGDSSAAWAAKQNPQLKASYHHTTGLVYSVALRKDNTAMRALLENALECMKLDGTLAKIHEKWLGYVPKPGSAAATIFPGTGVPGIAGYDPTPRSPTCG